MPGIKLFTNQSEFKMTVTLQVREGDDPRNRAASKTFPLEARQSAWHAYGSDSNEIYLNGVNLVATVPGELDAQQLIVIDRGSKLDNALNMNNAVNFAVVRTPEPNPQWVFTLWTEQVGAPPGEILAQLNSATF